MSLSEIENHAASVGRDDALEDQLRLHGKGRVERSTLARAAPLLRVIVRSLGRRRQARPDLPRVGIRPSGAVVVLDRDRGGAPERERDDLDGDVVLLPGPEAQPRRCALRSCRSGRERPKGP